MLQSLALLVQEESERDACESRVHRASGRGLIGEHSHLVAHMTAFSPNRRVVFPKMRREAGREDIGRSDLLAMLDGLEFVQAKKYQRHPIADKRS